MSDPAAAEPLVAECLAGVPDAPARLFAAYARVVREAILRFLALRCRGRTDLADDLTQEVFLALLRDGGSKLRRFEGRNGCSFAGWLRVVAVRLTIDHLRRDRRMVALDDDTPAMLDLRRALQSDEPDPEAHLCGAETATRLAAAIRGLAVKDQLLVELHVLRGVALEDVARALGVSMNAAYIRKSRVLDRLRSRMRAAQ